MINILLKALGRTEKKPSGKAKESHAVLYVVEEVLFWSALLVLVTGGGWVSVAGGALVIASIVYAVTLVVYAK